MALWYDYVVKYLGDNLLGGDVLRLCLVCQADAVTQYVVTYSTHILWDDVTTTTYEGIGTSRLGERYAGTRRASVGDEWLQLLQIVLRRLTCGEDDVDDLLLDLLVHIYILDNLTCLHNILGRDNLCHLGHTCTREVHAYNLTLLLLLGV